MKDIDELYYKYSKKIYNYLYYLTCDTYKADELTQETFYQAIISIAKFNNNSAVSTWLYSIARDVYLKYLRKNNRQMLSYDDSILADLASDAESLPEEMLLRKDTINRVRMVIEKLPESYATVLVLRDKEGLSYKEIA